MNKKNLIEQILGFDANLVWEIDDSKYYGLISGNGTETEWLKYELETMTNKFLKELLKLLSPLLLY